MQPLLKNFFTKSIFISLPYVFVTVSLHQGQIYLHYGLVYLHQGQVYLHYGLVYLHQGQVYLHQGNSISSSAMRHISLPSLYIVSFHHGLVYLCHELSLSPSLILHIFPFPPHSMFPVGAGLSPLGAGLSLP